VGEEKPRSIEPAAARAAAASDPMGSTEKILFSKSEPAEDYHRVSVFYATDRQPERDTIEIGALGLYLRLPLPALSRRCSVCVLFSSPGGISWGC